MKFQKLIETNKITKPIVSILIIAISALSIVQATSAIFEESVKVAGTSFSVGQSDDNNEPTNTALKILADSSADASESNLVDSINGPSFENITSDWTDQFAIKVHNKGDTVLDLVSDVDYVSDPDVLRDDIYVEVLEWNDNNSNGVVDDGELGTSYGYDTILRMRNDTFSLGQINPNETRGFVMKFDGTGVTDSNDGQQAIYDFLITGSDNSQ